MADTRLGPWFTGPTLERAIVATIRKHGPLDWSMIVVLGCLDHCSTYSDRERALAELVGRGELVGESLPKPGSMWDRTIVYSLASAQREGGAR